MTMPINQNIPVDDLSLIFSTSDSITILQWQLGRRAILLYFSTCFHSASNETHLRQTNIVKRWPQRHLLLKISQYHNRYNQQWSGEMKMCVTVTDCLVLTYLQRFCCGMKTTKCIDASFLKSLKQPRKSRFEVACFLYSLLRSIVQVFKCTRISNTMLIY